MNRNKSDRRIFIFMFLVVIITIINKIESISIQERLEKLERLIK